MEKNHPTAGGASLDDDILEAIVEAIHAPPLPVVRQDAMHARLLERLDPPPPEGSRTRRAEAMSWQTVLPLVEIKILHQDHECNQQTALWRLRPGAVVPAHRHTAVEECFVLEGAIRVGDHRVRQGDLHIAQPGCLHPEIICETGALLLIRAEIGEPNVTHAEPT